MTRFPTEHVTVAVDLPNKCPEDSKYATSGSSLQLIRFETI